jgi:predicted PurR-regulated permease PerM
MIRPMVAAGPTRLHAHVQAGAARRDRSADGSSLPRAVRVSRAWSSRDILRAAALVLGLYLALRGLWVARSVLFLAFLGVLFGLALSAGVDRLAAHRVPRAVGAIGLVLAFFGAFAGVGALAAPQITSQWDDLQRQLPKAVGRVEEWMRVGPGSVADLVRPPAEDSTEAQTPKAERQPSIRRNLAEQVGGLGQHFFTVFSSTLSVLGGLLLITFVAVYLAIDPGSYRRGLMHLVPHAARAKAGTVLDATGTTLRRWLVAQLIGMVTIGVITTIALRLIDVQAAVALGIIAGILEFVPYVGPILSAIPAIAMAFLDSPEKALYVALAYTAIQQIEGNVLTPLLMKEGLDLPPVLTIVSQAVFAVIFGFVGLLIAVPLVGAIMVAVKLLYVQDVVGDDVPVPGEAA